MTPSAAGDALRFETLAALTRLVDVDCAWFIEATHDGVRPHLSGPATFEHVVRDAMGDATTSPAVAQWYRRVTKDGVASRFERASDLFDRAQYEASVQYQRWLWPAGLDHQARVFLRHGDGMLGNLGVGLAKGRPPLSDAELAILSDALGCLTRSFIDAHALDVAAQPTGEGVILFDTRGEPTFADALGLAWLARPGLRAFLVQTAHAVTTRSARPPFPHGMDIHVVPLHGERAHHLALITPAAPIWLSPLSMLTPTQREVARLVGRGLAPTRVAAELSMSVETVRTHLKHIHQRLGISRRAELVRFVRETSKAA